MFLRGLHLTGLVVWNAAVDLGRGIVWVVVDVVDATFFLSDILQRRFGEGKMALQPPMLETHDFHRVCRLHEGAVSYGDESPQEVSRTGVAGKIRFGQSNRIHDSPPMKPEPYPAIYPAKMAGYDLGPSGLLGRHCPRSSAARLGMEAPRPSPILPFILQKWQDTTNGSRDNSRDRVSRAPGRAWGSCG